jgi:hypothetical protein
MPTLSNVVLEGRDRKDRCTQSVNSRYAIKKKQDYRKVGQARACVYVRYLDPKRSEWLTEIVPALAKILLTWL